MWAESLALNIVANCHIIKMWDSSARAAALEGKGLSMKEWKHSQRPPAEFDVVKDNRLGKMILQRTAFDAYPKPRKKVNEERRA